MLNTHRSCGGLVALLVVLTWPALAAAQEPVIQGSVIDDAATDDGVEATAGTEPALLVGLGLRSGLAFDPGANGEAATLRADDQLNLRPYLSGTLNRYMSFEGNLDVTRDEFVVLDAVAKFSIHPLFNVWAGRFLPPSSRANLSGPYFQNAWNYPLEINGFPNNYAGRDDGIAVWGQVGGGAFKYQVGVFDLEPGVELERSRVAGRIVYNVLDPEPGYYNFSTYYGEKEILAFAVTAQYANDMAEGNDFLGIETDVLYETKLGDAGVLTLEGAYFNFENDDMNPSSSFYALASYLLPQQIAIGRLQPTARWEFFDRECVADPDGCTLNTFDVGVNYIIDGHNSRLALTYRHVTGEDDGDAMTVENADSVQLGVQIQIL